MKLNKYFLIGAMGLGLFACSDELNENGNQDGNQPQEGTTYAAISLKFGNGDAARNVSGDYNQTDDNSTVAAAERDIKKLQIFVVDGSNVEAQPKYTPNGGADDTDTKDDIQASGKYIIAMTPGEKTFYAIINADEDFKGTTATDLNKYLTEAVIKKTSDLTGTNGFMMASVTAVSTNITGNVQEDDAANKNPVTVEVDRVVAKATVVAASTLATSGIEDPAVQNIGTIEFALGNADLDKTTTDGTNYPETGFCRMQSSDYATPYSTFIPDENSTHTAPDDYFSITYTDGDQTYAKPLYCLENTHTTYKQGNTTYAAIKVPIILKKHVTFTYTSGSGDITDNLQYEEKEDVKTNPESFYYVYGPNELRGKYILSSTILGLATEMNITGDEAVQKEGVIKKLTEDFGYSISKEYTDGMGYYKAWLNLSTDGNSSPVYRNNWYELTITKLTLPGEPGEPGIDPELPLTPPTNAEITVSIRDWNRVEHDVELQ